MNCRQIEPLLSKHVDGSLPPRAAERVVAHLEGCPACRRLREQFIAIGARLREPLDFSQASGVDRRAIERWIAESDASTHAREARSRRLRRTGRGVTAGGGPAWLTPRLVLLGAALSALAAALGLARWERSRTGEVPAPRVAQRSAPRQETPERRPASTSARGEPGKRMALSAGPSRGVPGRARRSLPPAATGGPGKRQYSPRAGVPAPRPPALLGDDLAYVNQDPADAVREWAPLTWDEQSALEARVRRAVQVQDDFVQIPFPRLASTSERQIAEAVESYKREAAIVDPRLSREVSLACKGMALSDLCGHLRSETDIRLTAGPSIADEKVTIFCEKMPLRDVMRQLSRPFGYTWLRSTEALGVRRWALGDKDRDSNAQRLTPNASYRYELVQDLRSQLLEEELRNRDRRAALLALDRDMEQYRPYLSLSQAEAEAQARKATGKDQRRLEQFSAGWGPIQMYFRLSPPDLAALRAGKALTFSSTPGPGQELLAPDLVRGMFHAQEEGGTAAGVGGQVVVWIHESELGEYSFGGSFGLFGRGDRPTAMQGADRLAIGVSPAVVQPDNAAANAALARDPALRSRVTLRPRCSCCSPPDASATGEKAAEPKVTTADVLEALHEATGLPVVADFYTRLYLIRDVRVQDQPLVGALNQISDTMRLRWRRDGRWLQFRSASYYDDRLKEVPNRLLTRWSERRRPGTRLRVGGLTLNDLIEIAQLPDAQLDAASMAEGARECWGLAEWDAARNPHLRPHWRYLASFTPAQREEALSANGLPFTRMTLAQQQQFLAFAFGSQAAKPEELAQASVHVEYTPQSGFHWAPAGSRPSPFRTPPVRERTREAALQAARRIDPQATAAQVVPVEWNAEVDYLLGPPNHRYAVCSVWIWPQGEVYGGPDRPGP